MYSIPELADKLDIKYKTAWARAYSKYAKERWGVEMIELPDGTKKPYVPKDKIHLWLKDDYLTKPSKEELEQYENN